MSIAAGRPACDRCGRFGVSCLAE